VNGRASLLAGLLFVSSQAIGCGSTGDGSGEVPGSRMSAEAAQTGCVVVCPTCTPGTPCPQFCRIDCPPGVVPCGPTVCRHNQECCNESCGICTPPGGVCTSQVCPLPTPCVDNVLCIRGFRWSPEACHCVPDEPPGSCAGDADCRLFSDYCTGCDCRALSNIDPDPVCPGPGVQCFADPCQGKTAQCANGQCVVTGQCVQTQLCIRGFHWSPVQCECVPDRGPHALGRPHAPHRPHPPHSPHSPRHHPM
jgi:hypothetical protein